MYGQNLFYDEHSEKLLELTKLIIDGESGSLLYNKNREIIEKITPYEIVVGFHKLVESGIEMELIKSGVSKMLNLLYKTVMKNPIENIGEKSELFGIFIKNYSFADSILKDIKVLIRDLNKVPSDTDIKNRLRTNIVTLNNIIKLYLIKENVIFPIIESKFDHPGCVKIMWSIHDDIRRDLKATEILLKEDSPDMIRLNKLIGKIFFNIFSVKFRDERILFPVLIKTVSKTVLDSLIDECLEIGFPYVNPDRERQKGEISVSDDYIVNLKTGTLSLNQLSLLLNSLPIDITFVDENDRVKYFSTPVDRIFTRSRSIIGRKVQNCHPPESIGIVEKILNSFKSGEKDTADFRIRTGDKFILINYYALRDEAGNYRGVLEVTQDITSIKDLNGEKRLLEWES